MGFDAGVRHSLRKKPGDSLSTYGAHATGSPQWVAATHPSQVLKKKKVTVQYLAVLRVTEV